MNTLKEKKENIWIAIRLTQLPLDVLYNDITSSYDNSEKAIVVTDKQYICACNKNAQSLGVHIGMTQAQAQILLNNTSNLKKVVFTSRKKYLEDQKILDLCDEIYLLTPYIKVINQSSGSNIDEQGFIIEISGSIKLFDGIENILERIHNSFNKHYTSYNYNFGHTEDSAWILSYHDKKIDISDIIKDSIQKSHELPLHILYKFSKEIEKLNSMGFYYFKDFIGHKKTIPLKTLKKRLSPELSNLLYKIYREDENQNNRELFTEVKTLHEPQNHFEEGINLDFTISNTEDLKPYFSALIDQLETYLDKHSLDTHSITWKLLGIHQQESSFVVSFDEENVSFGLILELSNIHLEQETLDFEVDHIQLYCNSFKSKEFKNKTIDLHENNDLFSNKNTLSINEEIKNNYIVSTTKLFSRIGKNSVSKLYAYESHIPEEANTEQVISDIDKTKLNGDKKIELNRKISEENKQQPLRPKWLFDTPKPIGKQQNQLNWQGHIQLIQGPERIQGNWWHTPLSRDYFIGLRDDFTRVWVYYDLKLNTWFAQGIFT